MNNRFIKAGSEHLNSQLFIFVSSFSYNNTQQELLYVQDEVGLNVISSHDIRFHSGILVLKVNVFNT